MTLKLANVIGHRGAAAYAPENTLDGIQTAADMGIEWVELDVKLTRDNVPILFHDETLDRTTNGSGLVAQTDYEDLKHLEAGSWFGDSFAGTKIPTLEDAIEILIAQNLGLNLEIKPCPGREKETAEIALDVLSQYWDDHQRLVISSFQPVSLEAAQDIAPDWARGFLLPEEWPENWRDMAEHLEVSTFNPNARNLTREKIELIIDTLDIPIITYTENSSDRARQLHAWGVDSIITDNPDLIMESIFTIH